MAAPQNIVSQNGISQLSGDFFNSLVQWDVTVSQLRGFIGVSNMMVYLQGFSSSADGGQGIFYWNSANTNPDDGGMTTVVPSGAGNGGWNRLPTPVVNTYFYQVPLTGFNITIPNYTNTLILNPTGTLATGTIIMPSALFDGQRISLSSSQTVSALTINPNSGQTIIGAPTSITSTTPVSWIYKLSLKTFFRGG